MSDKTKAALQGRQCHYQKLKQSQDTGVNAGGQSLSVTGIPVSVRTAATARLGGLSKSGHSPKGYTNFPAHWQITRMLGCSGCTALAHTSFPQTWGELDQRAGCTAMQHISEKSRSFDRYPDIGYQLFGSMLLCCNSLRMMRLIQAARDSSPSCCWACSISSRNSGSSLNWNGGLPRFSFLCVDTLITPDVMCLCVMTHYIHTLQIATPRSAGTLPRRLTTTDRLRIEAAMKDHITYPQGRKSYTWRFLALNRHDKEAKPCRLSVEAATEREARSILAPHFVLSLAARLPVLEAHHA